ncbi:EpsG family protein [Jeotgalibacillus malaysiensis]|uniref:EpsG family protein n=1 Tax=Jeotgalibacillus malaysiensis TaxID=1508404 RepID=UPI00384F98D5
MTVLWLTLITVFLLGYMGRFITFDTGHQLSVAPPVLNKHFIVLAGLLLGVVSGLRSNIGDTHNYVNIYTAQDFTWDYILENKDPGFGVLQRYLKMISDDPQIMIFTTGVITNILIVLILLKYSKKIELSLFVYITGGFYLVSMNGIRQTLAAAIAFVATKFLLERKFVPYASIIVLASFFHQSVLIMIPIYFIVGVKAWSKSTIGLIILAIGIVIGFDLFTSVLFSAIEDTQYAAYKDFDEGGANVLRVAAALPPLMVAFLGRGKLRRIMPHSDVFINMTILSIVFLIVSTQSWIFARFSLYFMLYQLVLISWIIELFRRKDQKFIYYAMVGCYFLYYYYENVVSLDITYKSNYIPF